MNDTVDTNLSELKKLALQLLTTCIKGGQINQAEILELLHDASDEIPHYQAEIEQARDDYTTGSDNDMEIDAKPLLSVSEGGVWVSGWFWVAIPEDENESET